MPDLRCSEGWRLNVVLWRHWADFGIRRRLGHTGGCRRLFRYIYEGGLEVKFFRLEVFWLTSKMNPVFSPLL